MNSPHYMLALTICPYAGNTKDERDSRPYIQAARIEPQIFVNCFEVNIVSIPLPLNINTLRFLFVF